MNAAIEQGLVAVPHQSDAMAIFTAHSAEGVDPLLAAIRAHIDGYVTPDLKTAKGRRDIASFAHKITQSKTALEEVGKALADEAKSIPKKIDASRKKIRDTLDQWRDEVRQPLTDWEAAEKARMKRHADAIGHMNFLTSPTNEIGQVYDAKTLRECLAWIEAVEIGPHCEEFEVEYARAKIHSLDALKITIAAREKLEAEQAELVKLRHEAAERAAKDREEAIRREAAEAAQKAAEARAQAERRKAEDDACRQRETIEAAAKAERDAAEKRELELRLQAERAEKLAAETEARIRREAEEAAMREAAETAKREKDRAHKTNINRAAVLAFVAGGMTEDCAKLAVTLIAKRSIPSVAISY